MTLTPDREIKCTCYISEPCPDCVKARKEARTQGCDHVTGRCHDKGCNKPLDSDQLITQEMIDTVIDPNVPEGKVHFLDDLGKVIGVVTLAEADFSCPHAAGYSTVCGQCVAKIRAEGYQKGFAAGLEQGRSVQK